MDKVYILVHFDARENGSRELLDCDLFATEEEAKEQMEEDVLNTITVYSRGNPVKEYPIRSVGSELWHEVNIPRECSENGKQIWITWEIREIPLPAELNAGR